MELPVILIFFDFLMMDSIPVPAGAQDTPSKLATGNRDGKGMNLPGYTFPKKADITSSKFKRQINMQLHFRNPDYVLPPGCITELLPHPVPGKGAMVELALFHEHRYAFFFWNKWTRKRSTEFVGRLAPCLVSLDWHQDLCWPTKTERQWLDALNTDDNITVAQYSWANLPGLNDGQIMAAVYLNLIGDIYVHCRQDKNDLDEPATFFTDKYGQPHRINKFSTFEGLEGALLQSAHTDIYFDIDLDYFTLNNPYNGVGKAYSYLSQKQIQEILGMERPMIRWIWERLRGFTIAIEPEHCGGLLKAHRLLNILDRLYFSPSLCSNYGENWKKNTNWRHLER